ncbi:MAG: oligosaccharide flippase family protein [Armatimonadota bacterium]
MTNDIDQERYELRRPAREMRVAAAITLIGGSSYVALVASLVRSILVMRLIGPRGRGIQRLVGLIKGYLSTLTVAFRHGASKELPLAIGARDARRAAEVEDATFVAVTGVTMLTALGLVVYGLFLSAGSRETRVALCVGGGLLLAEDLAALYWSVLRSWSRFRILALGELVRTAAQFVFMVGGAWLLGVTGVMLGWLAGSVAVLVYLDLASRLKIGWRVAWGQVWRLGAIGLPVALVSFADVLLRSVDGTVLVRFYGEEQFGLYSVAMQMATYLYAIPQAAGFVLWPKVLESYGADDSMERKRRRVILPTMGMAALMPVIGGVAWLLLPAAISLVVPKFAASVPAAQVLGMGATFLAMPMATNAALVASDQETAVILTKLAGSAVSGGGTWHLVAHQGSLAGVALAACAGYALAAVLSLLVQFRGFFAAPTLVLRQVLLALAPTAWVVAALWAAQRLGQAAGMALAQPGGAVVLTLVFLVLASPCLWWANRETGALGEIAAVVRARRSR